MAKNESLEKALASTLNKKNKGEKIAFFLDDTESPTHVPGWVSTGCSMLDLAISNRPHGGIPIGKITDINGLNQSGKSLVSAHLLANTQKKGGVAVLIDTESAASMEFMSAIGVDISSLMYLSLNTVEDIFEAIETIVEQVRTSKEKDRLVTIVVDSLAGASSKAEMEDDFDNAGYATQKAKVIGKGLRKITTMLGKEKITLLFTNQLRTRMGVSFGDPYTPSGGMALPFHSSVSVRLKKTGSITKTENGQKRIIGITVRAQITKNRMGPPLKSCNFDIFFDRGIDDYGSWFHTLTEYKLLSKSGAWYTYEEVDEKTGEVIDEHKFQKNGFIEMLENNPQLREKMYQTICQNVIMSYKTTGSATLEEGLEIEESEE